MGRIKLLVKTGENISVGGFQMGGCRICASKGQFTFHAKKGGRWVLFECDVTLFKQLNI